MASKKSSIDPKFRDQLQELQTKAAEEEEKRLKGEQAKWMRPKEWGGDTTDLDAMGDPFDRKQANEDYTKAAVAGSSCGVTGDLIVSVLQVETLAVMERAFRARHTMSFPRAVAHQQARRGKGLADKYGHGGEEGVFKKGILDVVQRMLKQAGANG